MLYRYEHVSGQQAKIKRVVIPSKEDGGLASKGVYPDLEIFVKEGILLRSEIKEDDSLEELSDSSIGEFKTDEPQPQETLEEEEEEVETSVELKSRSELLDMSVSELQDYAYSLGVSKKTKTASSIVSKLEELGFLSE